MFFRRKGFFVLYFFIMICWLTSVLVYTQKTETEKTPALNESEVTYPSTSHRYRGVVAMDADLNGADELYCDFGSGVGIWVYHNGSWTQISSDNPVWIISFQDSGTDYLLADFGTLGLWYWYYNGAWTGAWAKISNADASSAFATDDDGDGSEELHVNFGGLGLWRYDMGAATQWYKINSLSSNSSSLRIDIAGAGWEDAAHDFGSTGLWWFYWGPKWKKLSSSDPSGEHASAEIGNGHPAEELIIDFGSLGLWILNSTTLAWTKLNSLSPTALVAVRFVETPDYELLCTFGGVSGLWMWNYTGYPGTWTKINVSTPDYSGGFCEPFDPNGNVEGNGDQEVAVDFGSLGLWLYDYTGSSWTKLSSNNSQFMIGCDYFGDGVDTALVVDFGSGIGLWIYDGTLQGWYKINTLSPDGVN